MYLGFALQARGAFVQLLLIYLIISAVPLGLGTFLVFAPRRGGNFLNDAFAVFPQVEPENRLKKFLYRILGLALIFVSLFYIHQIFFNIVSPVVRFVRQR